MLLYLPNYINRYTEIQIGALATTISTGWTIFLLRISWKNREARFRFVKILITNKDLVALKLSVCFRRPGWFSSGPVGGQYPRLFKVGYMSSIHVYSLVLQSYFIEGKRESKKHFLMLRILLYDITWALIYVLISSFTVFIIRVTNYKFPLQFCVLVPAKHSTSTFAAFSY